MELFLEERRKAVEGRQDAAKRIRSPENNPADGMEEDCAGAHETRLECRKECHFGCMGAKMRWQRAESLHFGVAREIRRGFPDRVHPLRNNLTSEGDHSPDGEVPSALGLDRESDGVLHVLVVVGR